jgi:hypothetical protein
MLRGSGALCRESRVQLFVPQEDRARTTEIEQDVLPACGFPAADKGRQLDSWPMHQIGESKVHEAVKFRDLFEATLLKAG